MTLTPETLAELERLEAKATLAPWRVDSGEATKIADKHGSLAVLMQTYLRGRRVSETVAADAALIAAMRNALPALLSDLASAREEIGRLREALVYAHEFIREEPRSSHARNVNGAALLALIHHALKGDLRRAARAYGEGRSDD